MELLDWYQYLHFTYEETGSEGLVTCPGIGWQAWEWTWTLRYPPVCLSEIAWQGVESAKQCQDAG